MPKFGTWTPVTEEKPPLFEPVIITRIDKWGKASTDTAMYLEDGSWRLRGCGAKERIHAVISRMPYPAPMEYVRRDRP